MNAQINDDHPYNSRKFKENRSPTRLNQRQSTTSTEILMLAWVLAPSTSSRHITRFVCNRLAETHIFTSLSDAHFILAYLFQQKLAWVRTNFEYILNNEQAMLCTSLILYRAQGARLTALFYSPSESLRQPLS